MRKPCRWITNPLPWESDVSNDDEVGLFSEEADEELVRAVERANPTPSEVAQRLCLYSLSTFSS